MQVRPHHSYACQATPLAIGLHRDDALPATPLGSELREGSTLAKALLRDKEEVRRVVDDVHREYLVPFLERDPFDPSGRPAHRTGVALRKADAHPLPGNQNDLLSIRSRSYIDELVVFG